MKCPLFVLDLSAMKSNDLSCLCMNCSVILTVGTLYSSELHFFRLLLGFNIT